VLYWLEVDGMVAVFTAGFIFSLSGLLILSFVAWREAKAYAAARYRIYKRKAVLLRPSQFFASSLATSRGFSRFDERPQFTPHNSQ